MPLSRKETIHCTCLSPWVKMLCCLSNVCAVSVCNLQMSKFQYSRLYLLTLVLGIGGSFQFGMQVSVTASPALVQSQSIRVLPRLHQRCNV